MTHHAKKTDLDIGVRAKVIPLFSGPAKPIAPSRLTEPKPAPARWLPPKKHPNGGYDVRRGTEVRHFETLREAENFFEGETFGK